jgi:hypothetical protein
MISRESIKFRVPIVQLVGMYHRDLIVVVPSSGWYDGAVCRWSAATPVSCR